ncbi:hypothetical protein [Tenacibaculum sp.]|uniref:hypothetical protein n=1 Tax=Tenacibaculum sp. TaxID=1906242 RepID=UPI003D0CE74C
MITKEEAYKIALEVLKKKSIEYSSIDDVKDIRFESKEELEYPIPVGKFKGEKIDLFIVTYGEYWGLEERSMFIDINAETGEALYITTPHDFIELE